MKIIELVNNLKNIEIAQLLIAKEIPDVEYDLVDLYMVDKISIDSEIVFFNAEKIPNKLVIEIEGVKYENLFPLNLIQEMVEEYDKLDGKISDFEIANKLLEYRMKDA